MRLHLSRFYGGTDVSPVRSAKCRWLFTTSNDMVVAAVIETFKKAQLQKRNQRGTGTAGAVKPRTRVTFIFSPLLPVKLPLIRMNPCSSAVKYSFRIVSTKSETVSKFS